MSNKRSLLSVLLLVIAGIASLTMTAFGLFAGAWGGFGDGSNWLDTILHSLFWVLPSMSVLAFGAYFLSKRVGLVCSWAISIGTAFTIFIVNLQSCLAGRCTTTNPVIIALGVFVLPHIWILLGASVSLYIATVVSNKQTGAS